MARRSPGGRAPQGEGDERRSTPTYDPVAALESDLAAVGRRHGTATEQLLRDLLGALVWGEGEGVPGPLVPVLAQAVTGRAYSDDDVATLLTRASGHLGETEVDGRPVYRLADERLRHYLRTAALARGVEMGNGPSSADVSAAVHARLTEALFGAWRDAPAAAEPYLERVLPRHAALAGGWSGCVGSPAIWKRPTPTPSWPCFPVGAAH